MLSAVRNGVASPSTSEPTRDARQRLVRRGWRAPKRVASSSEFSRPHTPFVLNGWGQRYCSIGPPSGTVRRRCSLWFALTYRCIRGRVNNDAHGRADEASQLTQTCEAVQWLVNSGVYPGVQVYVSRNCEPVLDTVVGRRTQHELLGVDDPLPLLSASKGVLAAAIALLWERGAIDLDAPVCSYVPEYGANGKERVTVRHLLTHSVGPVGEPHRDESHAALARKPLGEALGAVLRDACAASLSDGDGPGTRSAYSPTWSWVLLAEIARRSDGRFFTDLVSEEVLRPIGARLVYGRPVESQGVPGVIYDTSDPKLRSLRIHRVVTEGAGLASPGIGLWGSAREIGKFFEFLLRRGLAPDGRRVLSEATVAAMTTPQRPTLFDNQPMIDIGLGLTIEGRRHGTRYAYFGLECSTETFGHYGLRSALIFCDPREGLVAALVGNGYPQSLRKHLAWRRFCRALYHDHSRVAGRRG